MNNLLNELNSNVWSWWGGKPGVIEYLSLAKRDMTIEQVKSDIKLCCDNNKNTIIVHQSNKNFTLKEIERFEKILQL